MADKRRGGSEDESSSSGLYLVLSARSRGANKSLKYAVTTKV